MKLFLSYARTFYTHLLIVSSLIFISPATFAAVSWETINANIQFLKQEHKLRFYDSNQILIEGNKCALLVDASGNFAAVEQLVDDLKQRLKTPLCYLVATHYHDDHLLGLAVIQHFYPHAKLIVHKQVNDNFSVYQQAFTDKLDGYEKSIELSYQRLANLAKEDQPLWRQKLERAKKRLFRWRKYQLNPPQVYISKNKTLNLGDFEITLNAHKAHTNGDLTISTNNGRILMGGDIVDWLPYPGHGDLKNWQKLLEQYINDPNLALIIPGHGGTLNKAQLKQPLSFLTALTTHFENNKGQTIEQLVLSFPALIMKPYTEDSLDAKSSNLFLQSGLARAKAIK